MIEVITKTEGIVMPLCGCVIGSCGNGPNIDK